MTTLPIVNINGTSKQELMEQQFKVVRALEAARTAICDAAPHGRDYQLNVPGAHHKAQEEHYERLQRLGALISEYNCLLEHLA